MKKEYYYESALNGDALVTETARTVKISLERTDPVIIEDVLRAVSAALLQHGLHCYDQFEF